MPINFPNRFEISEDKGFHFDGDSEDEIVEFFKQILGYLGYVEQFSTSNMKVSESGKLLYKSFVRLFDNTDQEDVTHLSISELHSNLQVNDVQLSSETQNKPVVAAFLFFMLENNILNIRFERSIPYSQFINLLNHLWISSPSDDLDAILAQENVTLAKVERQVSICTDPNEEPDVDIYEDESTISSTSALESDTAEVDFQSETPEDIDPAGGEIKEDVDEGVRIRRLIVKVAVGDHPLQGAKVQVHDGVRPIMQMTDLDGAIIELTPGEYDVQITYEQYKIDRRVTIPYDDRETVMVVDFQSIFEF